MVLEAEGKPESLLRLPWFSRGDWKRRRATSDVSCEETESPIHSCAKKVKELEQAALPEVQLQQNVLNGAQDD